MCIKETTAVQCRCEYMVGEVSIFYSWTKLFLPHICKL